jgi:hypothetical protein
MRLHHLAFGIALICAGFAYAAPMAWDRHAFLVIATLFWIGMGLALATGSKFLDLVHPTREEVRLSQRDLDRAYRAGRDQGAAEGPSEATLRRWRHEGFNVPGPGR